MLSIGFSLSSEEITPGNLVKYAQIAEEVGSSFALISDHFHPWVSYQGESPFVWTILGAIAQVTQKIQIGTKPVYLQMKVCWAPTKDEAKEVMKKWWPISALSGLLHVDLPTPKHFEDAVKLIEKPHIIKDTPLGPDPQPFLDAIQQAYQKGYDHIYLHQVGADQSGFLEFFRSKLLPQMKIEKLFTSTE